MLPHETTYYVLHTYRWIALEKCSRVMPCKRSKNDVSACEEACNFGQDMQIGVWVRKRQFPQWIGGGGGGSLIGFRDSLLVADWPVQLNCLA